MITSYQLFCEAIKLSDAIYYTKLWYERGGNNIHAEFFAKLSKGKPDTKYRLYYPFKVNVNTNDIVDSLESNITTLLTDNDYADVDYIGNKATDKYRRTVKISSVLAKLKQPDLLDKYNANLNRSNKSASKSTDEYKIVISRHPVDLAGMSTKRGWTSCMNIQNGENAHYIKADIEYGTLIAYIIKSTDTNIQNPIARCLIKPFENDLNFIIYLPEKRTYGTLSQITQKEFSDFIHTWCEDNLNKDIIDGFFVKNDDLYPDDGFTSISKISSLRKYLEDNYQVKNNVLHIKKDFELSNTNLTSLDTGGIKVYIGGDLKITDNPYLTTLNGIENFEIKGCVVANWKKIKDISFREMLLHKYHYFIKWVDDNTIVISYNILLRNYELTSIDTDGLKVIVNGDLDISNNPDLTSLKGLENYQVKGNVDADWFNIKDISLKQMILYKYGNKTSTIFHDDNRIDIEDYVSLSNKYIKTLDTGGLKVNIEGTLDIESLSNLTSLDGLDNFEVDGNIHADWKNIKGITLKQIILYKYKDDITWRDDNTIVMENNLQLYDCGLTSLDTEGLRILLYADLSLTGNPKLKSLKGLENFEVEGSIYADWINLTEEGIKQLILCKYKNDITWIDDNTIKIDEDVNLHHCDLTTLDTGGLKVIIGGDFYINYNKLKSLEGLENFEVDDTVIADLKLVGQKDKYKNYRFLFE